MSRHPYLPRRPGRRLRPLPALALALCASVPLAHAAAPADEHARSEAAVRAVEDHWLHAEGTGDTGYIDRLLLPEYRSVGADGSVHAKQAILAHAAGNRGSNAGMRAIEAYLAAHPSRTGVVLRDDLALVTFYDPQLGPTRGVRSTDVLIYREGGWHAIYSQHSHPGQP